MAGGVGGMGALPAQPFQQQQSAFGVGHGGALHEILGDPAAMYAELVAEEGLRAMPAQPWADGGHQCPPQRRVCARAQRAAACHGSAFAVLAGDAGEDFGGGEYGGADS